jgi:cellulase (glycosyl hydrolase family 5)
MKHRCIPGRTTGLRLPRRQFPLVLLGAATAAAAGKSRTVLGVRRDRFTVNGRPQFLLGISAFDATGRLTDSDLDKLRQRGFRLIRVWGYWEQVILNSQAPQVPANLQGNVWFGADGSLEPEKLAELKNLIERADRRGIILDLTVFNTFTSFPGDFRAKSLRGLKEVAEALKGCGNVLFDVYNEHNNAGRIDPATMTHEQLAPLVQAVRQIDPVRVVTFSNTHRQQGAETGDELARQYREELALEIHCLTPHLPRTPDFADRTKARVEWVRSVIQSSGRVVPLYLQEEARRRHSRLNPEAAEFFAAARAARDGGAAAWIFHTDAGYNLKLGSMFDRMDAVERTVVDRIAGELKRRAPS